MLRFVIRISLIVIFLQPALMSCSTEKQLAYTMTAGVTKRAILLMGTDILFKKNLNTDSVPGFKTMDPRLQDSALLASSRFLRTIQDSLALSAYLESMYAELTGMGFHVFKESQIDSFFRVQGESYMLNLAQAELEEYLFPVNEKEVYDDTLMYHKRFRLYGVNLNVWFELTELNTDKEMTVLFASHSARDQLNGGFQRHPLTLEVTYRYTVREIQDEDVSGLFPFSGNRDASYLYDYFLNMDIAKQKASAKQRTYWHYDRMKRKLKHAGPWKFELIGTEN